MSYDYKNYEHNYGRHSVSAPRQPKKPARNWKMIWIAIVSVVIVGIGLGAIAASYSSKTDNGAVTFVQQPKSAGEVADAEGCTGFQEKDPGELGMVITVGSCTKGGVKYAIDTFATQAVRDSWLEIAEKLGVVPVWETATSVTYKSVSS